MSFAVPADIELQVVGNIVNGNGEQAVVYIVAAQMSIAVGGQHFENAFVQFQDGNVEGTAAQIVNGDNAVFLLVETVGQ